MELREHPDWALIQRLGPANVARKLNTRIQRIQNWKYRGIPAAMKLAHPKLFMNAQHKAKA